MITESGLSCLDRFGIYGMKMHVAPFSCSNATAVARKKTPVVCSGGVLMKLAAVLILTAMLCFSLAGGAAAASTWLDVKTAHFTVFYQPGYEVPAETVLKTLEYYRPALEELIGNELFHLPVVLEDTGYTNGFADAVFRRMHLFVTPPGPDSGLGATENWYALVGAHEYLHMLSLSKTAGLVGFLRAVLGNLIIPNLYLPGWIVEGITVFGESQLSPYAGRLHDGYYDAYLGACVLDDALPSLADATSAKRAFPLERIYLFGGEFFSYLSAIYGRDKFARFFAANGASIMAILYNTFLPGFSLDVSAKEVFGKTFPMLWRDWQAYERERFKGFQRPGTRLTHQGWFAASPLLDGDQLYYQRTSPVSAPGSLRFGRDVMALDLRTGEERSVFATTAAFALPLRLHRGVLYYGVTELKQGFANTYERTYGEITVLHARTLANDEDRILAAGGIRAYTVLADGRLLYSKDRPAGFGSELHCYDPAADLDLRLGETDFEIGDLAADGAHLVAAARRDWANAGLYELSLPGLSLSPLVETPFVEARISLAEGQLFFTANYEARHGAYAYDFETRQVFRLTDNGYADSPVYDPGRGELFFVGLTSAGFDIYQTDADFQAFQPPTALAPTVPPNLELDPGAISRGNYLDNLATLRPKVALPYAGISPDGLEIGAFLAGADAIGDFNYTAYLLYNPDLGKPGCLVTLQCGYFAPLALSVFLADGAMGYTRALMLAAEYPLARRDSPGLNRLDAGVEVEYRGATGDWSLSPYLNGELAFPHVRADFSLRLPYYAGGETGLYVDLGLSAYVWGGEAKVSFGFRRDAAAPFVVALRGFDPFEDTAGDSVGLQFAHDLLRLGWGLWTPAIYFEDLYGAIFLDGYRGSMGDWLYAYGFELHLAGSATTLAVPYDLSLRYVVNSAGMGQWQLAGGLDLPL